jgi:hypothetical protein
MKRYDRFQVHGQFTHDNTVRMHRRDYPNLKRFNKYRKTLCRINDKIYSYNSCVGIIKKGFLFVDSQFIDYSFTTERHIRYVLYELDLQMVVVKREDRALISPKQLPTREVVYAGYRETNRITSG